MTSPNKTKSQIDLVREAVEKMLKNPGEATPSVGIPDDSTTENHIETDQTTLEETAAKLAATIKRQDEQQSLTIDHTEKLVKYQKDLDKMQQLVIGVLVIMLGTIAGLIIQVFWNYHNDMIQLQNERNQLTQDKFQQIYQMLTPTPTTAAPPKAK